MNAIAGVVDFRSTVPSAQRCRAMLAAQQRYFTEDLEFRESDCAVFGLGHHPALGAASSAYFDPVDGLLVVGDVRLDNRLPLLSLLGDAGHPRQADVDILVAAWRRWGDECFARLTGDFAIAVFDPRSRTLTLARDVTGQRPLFYARDDGTALFSSMPSGVLSALPRRPEFDLRALTCALLDIPRARGGSYFKGISNVPPGHTVTLTATDNRIEQYWRPPATASGSTFDDDVARYREVLDQSVAACLPSDGPLASHLSSGWDSGAVTATAARLLADPARLTAMSAAPLPGDWSGSRGRTGDESALARSVADSLGIEHEILRPNVALSDEIHAQVMHYEDPVRNLVNSGWLYAIETRAAALGCRTILSGELGNHGLNAGGLGTLYNIRKQLGLRRWWSETRRNCGRDGVRWSGLLYNSFAGDMPRPIRDFLRRHFLDQRPPGELSFLDPAAAAEASLDAQPDGWDGGSDSLRWHALQTVDMGTLRKGSLSRSGVDTRDPTANRNILEFSLALPPDRLLDRGIDRPLARAALADRLPPAILDNPLRGAQAVDWPAMIDVEGLRSVAEEAAASSAARSLIDFAAVDKALAQWPPRSLDEFSVYERYAVYLPAALATGLFIRTTESA